MTPATKPETEKKADGPKLTPKGEARMFEIKARNAMVQAIAGESWGAKLSMAQARAFAEYLRRFRLDISEIDNLGGRPYRNGRYYMRRIAELAAQDRVEWYKGRHIGPDARLETFVAAGEQWAIDERFDRLKECIRLGVPAEAEVVYLVTVKMKELAVPTEGVKWFTPGRKNSYGKLADPVGEENPVTSTETRAWRRVGRLAAAEIPELRDQEAEMEFAANETQAAMIEEASDVEFSKPVAGLDSSPYDETPAPPAALSEGPARPIETAEDLRRADAELVAREAKA